MNEPSRRHDNVVNLDEVPAQERLTGTRFGAKFRRLADPAGGKAIGCTCYEVPPGRAAMPFHFHTSNEEAAFVLEGTGELRIGDRTVVLRAGDWVSFPVGPQAHQIRNTGDAPLRYLGLSTKHDVDVIGYPDSKKVMAHAAKPGAKWGEPQWVRLIAGEESAVDYFHREPID